MTCDLLKPVMSLSGEAMQATSTHILAARVAAVERGAVSSLRGTLVTEVRVIVVAERVAKGPAKAGESLAFWGATVVGGIGAIGVSDTVPESLVAGDCVEVHLAEEAGRLVLPFWCALARLPRRAREAGDPRLAGYPAPRSMTSAGDQESWTGAGRKGRSA